MTRFHIYAAVLIIYTALAAPAYAQAPRGALEPIIRAVRAQHGPLVMPDEIGTMLNAIAWQARPNVKLLKKGGGGNCPSPQAERVSCDILIWAPPGTPAEKTEHIDIFSGASADGPATAAVMWKSAGPCTKRPAGHPQGGSGCEMKNALDPIAPGDTAVTPVDPGAPVPTPPSSTVLEQLGELKRLLVAEIIDRQDKARAQQHEMQLELAALRAAVEQLEHHTDAVGEQLRTMTFPCFTATSRVLGTVKLCPVN